MIFEMNNKSKAILIVSLIIMFLSASFLFHGYISYSNVINRAIAARGTNLDSITKDLEELSFTPYRNRIKTMLKVSPNIVEAFAKNPNDFDLVITDMTMPEMTGLALTSKLLELRPDLPVILCTGFSENINETTVKSLGIRDLLMKPIEYHTLAKSIKMALSPD